jgi:hypothetical protein
MGANCRFRQLVILALSDSLAVRAFRRSVVLMSGVFATLQNRSFWTGTCTSLGRSFLAMGRSLIFIVAAWSSVAYCADQLQDAPLFKPATAENAKSPVGRARTWVDTTGRFRTEATLLSRDDARVTLRKTDGIIVHVPIERLSDADKRHLAGIDNSAGIVVQAASSVVDAASKVAESVANQLGSDNRVTRKAIIDNAADAPGSAAEQNHRPIAADFIHVQISDDAMRRFLARPIARRTAVRDTIVGTPVQGTAHTSGRFDLRLVSADARAVIDLMFNGHVQSQTVGFGGPVQVHSNGLTRFSAIKRVILDEQGIELMPARAHAETSVSINGVTTDLPRLRGRIARRIGSRRAAASRGAAEFESARKAEGRVAREFDQEVYRQLLAGRSKLVQLFASLPIDRSQLAPDVDFSTSKDYLHVAIRRRDGNASPVIPPTPQQLGSPEIAVHVHASFVDHVVQNAELQRSLDSLIGALLGPELQAFVGIAPAGPHLEFQQSADGNWWSVLIRPAEASVRRTPVPSPKAKLVKKTESRRPAAD